MSFSHLQFVIRLIFHVLPTSGFTHEGRKREALWKEGAWVDIVWMGLLSTEYNAAPSGTSKLPDTKEK